MQPAHLDAGRRGQGHLVPGVGHLDQRDADRRGVRGGEVLEGGGDRRQGGLITGEQVPVGGGVGSVGAAGTQERDLLPHRLGRRPRPGQAAVVPEGGAVAVRAVDHEVDVHGAGGRVHAAHRVGAADRQLLRGETLAEGVQVVRGFEAERGVGEEQLHVLVRGALLRPAGVDGVELLAAEGQAHEVRGEPAGGHHGEDGLGPGHAGLLGSGAGSARARVAHPPTTRRISARQRDVSPRRRGRRNRAPRWSSGSSGPAPAGAGVARRAPRLWACVSSCSSCSRC